MGGERTDSKREKDPSSFMAPTCWHIWEEMSQNGQHLTQKKYNHSAEVWRQWTIFSKKKCQENLEFKNEKKNPVTTSMPISHPQWKEERGKTGPVCKCQQIYCRAKLLRQRTQIVPFSWGNRLCCQALLQPKCPQPTHKATHNDRVPQATCRSWFKSVRTAKSCLTWGAGHFQECDGPAFRFERFRIKPQSVSVGSGKPPSTGVCKISFSQCAQMHYISSSVDADLLYIFACSRGHTEATQGKTQTNSIVILKSQLLSLTLGSKTSVKKKGKKTAQNLYPLLKGKKWGLFANPPMTNHGSHGCLPGHMCIICLMPFPLFFTLQRGKNNRTTDCFCTLSRVVPAILAQWPSIGGSWPQPELG